MESNEIDSMALHHHTCSNFMFKIIKFKLCLIIRSADIFLGVPFNIASYALLTHLITKRVLNLGFGNLHLCNFW